MIRVLITDDSPTARDLLGAILAMDDTIEVVGEARDGLEAVRLTEEMHPDLVLMDAQMPRLDGFAATKEIMIATPTPIIMISATLDPRDVDVSMRALNAGALTVLEKPPGPTSPRFQQTARQFISTAKAMAQVKVVRHHPVRGHVIRAQAPLVAPAASRGKAVAIAASTGGPAALAQILAELPPNFAAPILVVQHISPAFTAGLTTWLQSICGLSVRQAVEGQPLAPGTVYIAPEDRHLGVAGHTRVGLSAAPPVGGFRPSATPLFESVAKAFGAAAVAVILTGMGEDGVAGLEAVRRAGGFIIAQDEATSVVFGMPGAAVAAGLPDVVLPLSHVASRLVELVGVASPK